MLNNVNNHKQLGAQTPRERDRGCLVLNKQITSHSDSENGRREMEEAVEQEVCFQRLSASSGTHTEAKKVGLPAWRGGAATAN